MYRNRTPMCQQGYIQFCMFNISVPGKVSVQICMLFIILTSWQNLTLGKNTEDMNFIAASVIQ
jgi:hypothetical protein